jgi:hypothetical protein
MHIAAYKAVVGNDSGVENTVHTAKATEFKT